MDIDVIRLLGCVSIAYFGITLFLKLRRIFYTHILAKSFGDIKNLPGYGAWAGKLCYASYILIGRLTCDGFIILSHHRFHRWYR